MNRAIDVQKGYLLHFYYLFLAITYLIKRNLWCCLRHKLKNIDDKSVCKN